MLFEGAARAGFAKAREIYTGKDAYNRPIPDLPDRYKSSNKLHLSAGSEHRRADFIQWGRVETHHQEARYVNRLREAGAQLSKGRVSSLEAGVFQIGQRLRKFSRAQNCVELACIAAEWAYTELEKPNPAPIALADFQSPGDHTFCIIADTSTLNDMKDMRVDQLRSSFSLSDDAWATDPWLNVCCQLCDYQTRAEAQLDNWQKKNKRISWSSGSAGAGWYPPGGEYSEKFMQAKLVLTPAT